MSQKIRIGNDIDIRWSLVDENENPYILEGRDVRIELNVGKKKIRITEIELNENTVHFIYYGKDQKYTGQYILKFIENDGNVEMVTFDTKDAFTLVEHSWLAIDDGEEPERVYLEFVTVTSNILERIGPTGPPAGFGEVTASIDDGVGTPTVDVSTSGPNTAKNITFNFHNLKGESAGVRIDLGSGSTVTGADIAAILADGKIPYAMNGEQYVYYAGSDNTYYYFQWDYSPSAQNAVQQSYRTAVPKNGAWGGSFSLVTPEDARNKVSTIIGNESDETKYPNTKAVYDFINGKYQRIYNCDISEVTNPVEGDVCIASIETETQISLPSGVTSSEISLPGSTFRWKKSYASLAPLNGVTLTWRELEGEWQESKLPDRNNRGTITTGDATTAYLSWGSSGNLSGLTFYSVESVPSPYIYLNGSWVLSSDIALNVYVAVPINNEYDVSSIEAALAAGKVVFIPDGVFCGRDQGNNLIFVLPKYDGLGFYVTTINATYGTWSSEEINLQQAITSSNKLDFSLLSNTPTTLAGYGITNAYTKNEIDAKVSSVYKPAGSAASVAALGSLTAANLGNVYNMSAAFTTTSDFVEGASKDYPAGTNVVIVNTGTDADPVYKYDVLAGMVDLSGYEETTNKVTSFGSTPSDSKYPSEKLVKNSLDAKQDTISDLSTIRSGAAAGATAYQKPGTGIPKTDLASAVQTSLGKADSAVQPADIPDPLLTYTESGEIDPTVTPADYATTEQLSQLSQEVTEADKGLEAKISDLRFFVGADTAIELTPLDYTGMRFVQNTIGAGDASYDAFMVRVQKGIEYDINQSPISVRISASPFVIGGNTGSSATFPITPAVDDYLLITVAKSAGNYTITKAQSGLTKAVNENTVLSGRNSTSLTGEYYTTEKGVSNNRVSRGIRLPFRGTTRVTVTVVSGTDTDKWSVFRYTNGAIGTALAQNISFGDSAIVTIPEEDDGIWLFTLSNTIASERTYGVKFDEMSWTIKQQVDNLTIAMEDVVGTSWYPENITTASGRVSKSIYIGHGGKTAICAVSLVSGTDMGRWRLYGTSADGSSIDVNTTLTDYMQMGKSTTFTVPSNGYVWLFTEDNSISTPRTYFFDVYGPDSILARLDEMQPLSGKTIVCFGDSITEFKYNGKGYCDYLADMLGATVINVGIGGTQLRQRTTPSLTPTTDTQCYAGLDIVNMVKSAMTNDFAIAEASAAKLATISADDNTAIVARLKAVDWSKVDVVTVLGGTNDWYNNVGNTGDKDSSDVSLTCGAINDIIQRICSTYKGIKLYWLTPLIRVDDPANFSAETQYHIGDFCTYSGLYYQFTADHLGAWDAGDVSQVTRADFRIPMYSSDNVQKNGKNLREFSALLASVAENNHIPVLDLYNELGWNLYNFSEFFISSDNTHPYKGFKWMAEKIAKFLTAK